MEWSAPDTEGICSLRLGDPTRVSLKDRRLRRAAQPEAQLHLDTWPAEDKALLAEWVRRVGDKAQRHDSLLRVAGGGRGALAHRLLHTLLRLGLLEVEEHFERGSWWPRQIRFVDPARLRRELGLAEPDAALRAWEEAREQRFEHPELDAAVAALNALPPARALQRLGLLHALAEWQRDGRSGTWRDFAQFARGNTKQISAAEKNWLAESLSLDEFRIAAHTPLLLLRAGALLHGDKGSLNLGLAPDFCALTPATLDALHSGSAPPRHWHLVENQTSFERLARQLPDEEGVIWLPGYPPSWWRKAVTRLIQLLPAPARIACDPDPDGIAIALEAAQLWVAQGLEWHAWQMDAALLAQLPTRRPLDERDHSLLTRLQALPELPTPLRSLAEHLARTGEKGEQEGYL